MHRVLAALVALAMLSTSGSAALQHVHAYLDHDHADHHHGPASHGHSAPAPVHAPDSHATDSPVPDDVARVESCDPGEHTVPVFFTYVAPHPDHVPASVTLEAITVPAPEQARRHVTPSDVRAHSPPRLTDAPLRAPPVVHVA